jgi:drug/metabolite transporter (DMT)-like permease
MSYFGTNEPYDKHTAAFMFLSFIIPIIIFNLWWLIKYRIKNQTWVWIYFVLMGILYVVCTILVYNGFYPLAAITLTLGSGFLYAMAGYSGIKKIDGSADSNFICHAITPLMSGICFNLIGYFILWRLANNKKNYVRQIAAL